MNQHITGTLKQLLQNIHEIRTHPQASTTETEPSLCPYCQKETDELDLCTNPLCTKDPDFYHILKDYNELKDYLEPEEI